MPAGLPAAGLHWGASAALSPAGRMSDTAKIPAVRALGIAALTADLPVAFAVVALAAALAAFTRWTLGIVQ